MSCCFHHVPGRLRIKAPSLKNAPYDAEEIVSRLDALDGITAVRVNTLTGSMVIRYDLKRLGSDRILDIVGREDCFDLSTARPLYGGTLERRLSKIGEIVCKLFLGIVIDYFLEGSPVALLIGVI